MLWSPVLRAYQLQIGCKSLKTLSYYYTGQSSVQPSSSFFLCASGSLHTVNAWSSCRFPRTPTLLPGWGGAIPEFKEKGTDLLEKQQEELEGGVLALRRPGSAWPWAVTWPQGSLSPLGHNPLIWNVEAWVCFKPCSLSSIWWLEYQVKKWQIYSSPRSAHPTDLHIYIHTHLFNERHSRLEHCSLLPKSETTGRRMDKLW